MSKSMAEGGTSSKLIEERILLVRGQKVMLDSDLAELYGVETYLPYAFTEQGVAMLSGVLNSERAIHVNIEIMRAFVRLRQLLLANAELARKLEALERKYDAQFKVVFDAIRELMAPAAKPKRPIGFVGSP
jgi:hypothetical protein